MSETEHPPISVRRLYGFVASILGPDSGYYYLALLYGVGISLLSLATPISVQMLINNVANTGLTTPLIVLTLSLLGLLLLSGLLNALRIQLMDVFQRRFYARMVAEISLRTVYALNPFFQDYRQGALFNRYFDIVIIQKNLPNLLVSGFTIVLQAVVGFILVSLYHPLFLVFNVIVAVLIWAIWVIWGRRAVRSAVEVSHKKHETAAWLQNLGYSNGFYKSERHINEALNRTDEVTADYIGSHIKHFRHHFAQTIGFLLLYAAASAVLLGLGGWLVIQGELTLGQLVAAELVLSAAFYGASYLGIYLAYFYEMCGAIDELSLFFDVEQEQADGGLDSFAGDASLKFASCRGTTHGMTTTLDFEIISGARVMGVAETHGIQREFSNLLKRHIVPRGGYIAVGGVDVMSVSAQVLRQQIVVLDRPNTVETTIREYLDMSSDDATARSIEVLRLVGLEAAVMQLDDGLDTPLALTGWPLTIGETMQLKLAAAILSRPKVLVLSQLFDTMPDEYLRRSLDVLQQEKNCTVIYFTARRRDMGFDAYLNLGTEEQTLFPSFEALCANTLGDARRAVASDDAEAEPIRSAS
jgi:ABC-type bacteriocin/lantibiotic exporter with double-glycine peptidase domain